MVCHRKRWMVLIDRRVPNVLRRELIAHESRLPVVAFGSLAAQPSINCAFPDYRAIANNLQL